MSEVMRNCAHIIGIIGMLLMLSVAGVRPALADGLVGDGTPESCTPFALRNAIKAGGLITFSCGAGEVVITVTSQLQVNKPTTIDGTGGVIVLSGGGTTRIIRNSSNLTLRNLALRDGYAKYKSSSDVGNGGAVENRYRANLTVENVQFINNQSQPTPGGDNGGGAIRIHGGTLTVSDSLFSGNKARKASGGAIFVMLGNAKVTNSVFVENTSTAPGYAGAFYNDGTREGGTNGYITLLNNRFEGNTGHGQGGAVFNFLYPWQPGSRLIIRDSAFTNNAVTAGDGLGGALRVGNGPATIQNTYFYDNRALRQGGALWTGETARVTLTNVTMTGNEAELGGALTINSSGAFKINNSTIVYNTATGQGGGIFGGGSHVTLMNSIVAHNTAGNPWNINHNCGRALKNGGNNLQFPKRTPDQNDHNCAGGTGMRFLDPLLGAYDGVSGTHAPLSGSPAIDKGNNTTCAKVDQRKVARPQGERCDIGAFEVEAGVVPLPPARTGE